MKCPLTARWVQTRNDGLETLMSNCLKEECGQWDKDKGMCSRVSETVELRLIRSLLREIREKMPSHERLV